MKTITIPELPPGKLNTVELQAELAASMKLDPSDIGISICRGGLLTTKTAMAGQKDLSEKVERIPAMIEVHMPDDIAPGDLLAVVRAHAPEMNDAEAVTAAQEQAEDDRISNHPIVQQLKAQVEAIANVDAVRTELAAAAVEVGRQVGGNTPSN